MLKKYTALATVMSLLIILAACSSDQEESQEKSDQGQEEVQQNVEISEDELVPEDETVAIINGHDVNGKTYNIVYSQLKLSAGQMGQEIDLDEMKEATLDSLIDRELLMQEAEENGIKVTNEKVGEELDNIKESNKEDLDTVLEQYQMSEDDFKEQLKFELAMNEFKESLDDVKVTDEEIEEYYEQAKEGNDGMPELDEIQPELEKQMKEQKLNEALEEKINKVKENADIEKKIEV